MDRNKNSIPENIALAGVVFYALVQFNPHVTALRNLSLYGAICAGVVGTLFYARGSARQLRGLHYVVIGFLAWTILSSALGERPDYSFMHLRKSLGTQLILAFVVWYAVRGARQAAILYACMVLAMALMAGLDIIQYSTEIAAPSDESYIDYVPLHYWYAVPLSMMISYSVPLVLARTAWIRVAGACLLAVSVFLLIDADSRAGWGAGFLGVATTSMLLKSRKVFILCAAIFIAAIAALIIPQSFKVAERLGTLTSTQHRIECCWGPFMAIAMEKPVLGYGFGRDIQRDAFEKLAAKQPNVMTYPYLGAHNTYLDVLVSFGLVGLVLFVLVISGAVSALLRSCSSPSLDERWRRLLAPTAGTLLGMFGFAVMFQNFDYRFLGIFLGIALASTRVIGSDDTSLLCAAKSS